jgi:hypothetical protein
MHGGGTYRSPRERQFAATANPPPFSRKVDVCREMARETIKYIRRVTLRRALSEYHG